MVSYSMFYMSFLLPVLDSRLDSNLWVCNLASALTLIIFQVLSFASERRLREVPRRSLELYSIVVYFTFLCKPCIFMLYIVSISFFEMSCIIVKISYLSIWGLKPLSFLYGFMSLYILLMILLEIIFHFIFSLYFSSFRGVPCFVFSGALQLVSEL